MVFYKVLNANGRSCNGGSMQWSLPTQNKDGSWTPGEWTPTIEGELVECWNGYHLATLEQLPLWLNERIFVAEVDGDVLASADNDKWIARKVRLVSETAWDERTARLFACDCAEHVLPIYEQDYPDDNRPRHAIEVARRYANGEATVQELTAARDAAWDAGPAAKDGWDATRPAWDATWAAAWAAAADAVVAVGPAAGYAERKWQAAKLAEYLHEAETVRA